jgi:hypothetical protein
MYRVINTFKKLNDSDVWIIPTSTNYFADEEQPIIDDVLVSQMLFLNM